MGQCQLVIFDFCDTLVEGQTADPFLRRVLVEANRQPLVNLTEGVQYLRKRLPLWIPGSRKKQLIASLKGLSREKLESISAAYAAETLIPSLKADPVQHLRKAVESENHVLIISGGFTCNIKDFLTLQGLPHVPVIANEFEIRSGKLTGNLKASDCLGVEKIRRLNQYLKNSSFAPTRIKVYSDHVSDLPLFAYADEKVIVVSRDNAEFRALFPWSTLS